MIEEVTESRDITTQRHPIAPTRHNPKYSLGTALERALLAHGDVNTLDTSLQIRLSREDRERWGRAAEAAGLKLSQWIRAQCVAAAGGRCVAVAVELRTSYPAETP